ncbi:MAG: glycosyltransferase family 9 protein [Bacteroidetes bacterium]|nr:MAG: glycosyltransferase family 9 protein [Bacteroidota bacterium]MBL1143429.1 glycosyltransferase family 9 protein [Bacteroidota bacterium]MCB0802574.1 glycosyltransferase family 9 protein [Flavobacteriales bacterium]NOG56233.1 glycosyltransferase family 9 protein [Bacteroidota bacterium]
MKHQVKVLIIRFSSIGDIVLTTPVIRCLKNQLEGDVEIHYVTKKSYASLLTNNPHISKVHTIEKSTNEIIKELQSENFDYIVDLHKNLRSARLKKKLPAFSFSFEKLNWEKWLLVNLKINRLPEIHIVDRYLKAVKALGIKNDGLGLDYFLPDGIEKEITIPETHQNGFIALVLGANHATKRIPKVKLIELIESSNKAFILIGGKEDQELGVALEKMYPDQIYNAAGETNLNQSAYLIKQAQIVISPDTGMMHIAAAFQKEIISVWGNTVPEFGMYPYYKKGNEFNSTIVENKNIKCRPCSKIGFNKCPKGHFKCMMELDLKIGARL